MISSLYQRAVWTAILVLLLIPFAPRAAGAVEDDPYGTPDAGAAAAPAGEPPVDDEIPSPESEGLVPPELLEYVAADYPPEAFAAGVEATVVAELAIDETGQVVAVQIVAPAGQGFDEAAAAAMARFRFRPARNGGVTIPSRVTYRYRFFIEEAPDAAAPEVSGTAPPAPSAELIGRVIDLDDVPIPDALVQLLPAALPGEGEGDRASVSAALLEAVTDKDGRFTFGALAPGPFRLTIIAPGFLPLESEEVLEEREIREVRYRLAPESSEYEVVVRSKRPSREVTRRTVTQQEITKIPGTGGDALRAVQNLPGMARAPMAGGEILIRGSSPWDSVFFLDALNMPLLYHFGGLTSVVNSDLLESIDYYPGNFSARFGRATGGVIDVKTRAPKTDRLHAYIDADIWDVGALIEGPIGKKWSVAGAFRRSYIDSFMKAANLMGDDITLTVAPRYYDFQLVADYHPSKDNNLRLFFYGTDDRWVMDWDELDDPFWGGGLDTHLMTYQGQADWYLRMTDHLENRFNLGFGYWGGNYDEGNMKQDWNVFPLLVREELTFDPGKYVIWRLGTDNELRFAKVKMKVPTDYGLEGENGYNYDSWLTFEGNRSLASAGLYTELELVAIPRTQIIYGLRGDFYSAINEWGVDPRVAIRFELFPTTTLKGGVGLFQQPPDMALGDKEYGNPDLDLTQAIHYSAGVEQRILSNIEIGLEGFYKDLRNVIRSSDEMVERNGEMVPERYNNDSTGRIYGMEVQVKHQPTKRFFGWITYTLMRSERFDEPGAQARLFDWDQTHILNIVGNVIVGWGIDIGLRFRLVSGNPYTPKLGSSYDGDHDDYTPIYGANNSGRLPLFHQLDLRIDKKWQWRYLACTLYLDVQNVYNRKNIEYYEYSFDYKQKAGIQGLPIIPSLGLKLEY